MAAVKGFRNPLASTRPLNKKYRPTIISTEMIRIFFALGFIKLKKLVCLKEKFSPL
jgi:hypothetical protein